MQNYQPSPLQLEDFFVFGKHEGEQVEDVIEDDPEYFTWLYDESFIEFHDEVVTKLQDKKII